LRARGARANLEEVVAMGIEPFLTPKLPRHAVPVVSSFRSTWVASSVLALRGNGLIERYTAQLAPDDRPLLLYAVAGSWLPADLVVRHYEACDRLGLEESSIFENGAAVTKHVHGSTLTRVARAVGVTPWTLFAQLDRLWDRVMLGGAVAVGKVGPKEARVELLGFPLAHIRYNRIATRGILHALCTEFCRRVFVREEPAFCTRTTLGYRLQWA
jgi:hypothetical protein